MLICLYRCVLKHKAKITLGLINQEYLIYCNKFKWKKMDILQVKKVLEELYNSNLIHIKSDEKYQFLYELKLPVDETKTVIKNLEKIKNTDTSLITSNMLTFIENLS
jgi:hypothetical protein